MLLTSSTPVRFFSEHSLLTVNHRCEPLEGRVISGNAVGTTGGVGTEPGNRFSVYTHLPSGSRDTDAQNEEQLQSRLDDL